MTRELIEFDNKAIESFESEFSYADKDGKTKWRNKKYTPFNVPKNGCLKGLKLYQTRNDKSKKFVVQYWFNGSANYWTIGEFSKDFGTKEVEKKLFDLSQTHKDNKENWIRDPKKTERENNRVIAVADYQISQKKTINEVLIEYVKANYPRAKQDGFLEPISIAHFNRYAFGFSERIRHIKIVTVDHKHHINFIDNKHTRMKAPISVDQLFERYPPGKYLFKKKHLNPNKLLSIFDSDIGKTLLDDLTPGSIKRFIAGQSYGVQRHIVHCFKYIWAFGLDQGYLCDTVKKNTTQKTKKKPRVSKSITSQYSKKIFKDEELPIIYDTLDHLRKYYPFQAECLMLMMTTSIREEEIRKLEWDFIDYKNRLINLPGEITKGGKARQTVITGPVLEVLHKLEKYKTRPGFEWTNFVKWVFPTPRFRKDDFQHKRLPPEYINSSESRLKQITSCWKELRDRSGIYGVPKMFRKTYSTKAKDILGQTGFAIRLTGHEEDSTLDRFYYGSDLEQIKTDADKVAQVFDFKKKA